MSKREAINWNIVEDPYTLVFWRQNLRQFWVDEEIPLSGDKSSWTMLNQEEKEVYKKVLAGLTLLDTEQATVGMPQISSWVDDSQKKAILSFMGFMEHMHTKSYSSIFSTLCSTKEISQLFDWVSEDSILQKKTNLILEKYNTISSSQDLFLGMAASVFLESFLFYSGFFYPLLLAGEGKMVNSGEIINLIIRDESIHGVYVGILTQNLFKGFSKNAQEKLKSEVLFLQENLMKIEDVYAQSLYGSLGIVTEVKDFSRYNCDKALMNMGFEPIYEIDIEKINPIVIKGLDTKTKNHDFFSTKGNGYIKPLHVEDLSDEDFQF